MVAVFSGTLTGQGIASFPGGLAVPTDVDVNVLTIGPSVRRQGPSPFQVFKGLGWIQFLNSTYTPIVETVSVPYYLNCENDDMAVFTVQGVQADGFAYFIDPSSSVHLNVSD